LPDPELVARFAAELDALAPSDARLGVAVSGGPDSLALLLLAASARPGAVEAATVDHRLREGSDAEASAVAAICSRLAVAHRTLALDWERVPEGNLQAQARDARYAALAAWAADRELRFLATAHHLDDQAETLLMRLARGSGISGLAGVRRIRALEPAGAGAPIFVVRPLLRWRREELRALVETAGLPAVDDPSNHDPRHERTRARRFLSSTDWPDPARLAASASNLADGEEALRYAADKLYSERRRTDGQAVLLDAAGLPRELSRRLLLLAFREGHAAAPRGPELMRLIAALERGETATLGGIKLEGGSIWRLSPAPPRNR
jgi:tRNA(Ile)-lysidine synthase